MGTPISCRQMHSSGPNELSSVLIRGASAPSPSCVLACVVIGDAKINSAWSCLLLWECVAVPYHSVLQSLGTQRLSSSLIPRPLLCNFSGLTTWTTSFVCTIGGGGGAGFRWTLLLIGQSPCTIHPQVLPVPQPHTFCSVNISTTSANVPSTQPEPKPFPHPFPPPAHPWFPNSYLHGPSRGACHEERLRPSQMLFSPTTAAVSMQRTDVGRERMSWTAHVMVAPAQYGPVHCFQEGC